MIVPPAERARRERQQVAARAQLDEAAWAAAWDSGRRTRSAMAPRSAEG